MLNDTKKTQTQWMTVDKLVATWLQERQELIRLYCAVDGLKEFTPKETPLPVKIQALCNVLIDYMSAGHFEIYDKLVQEAIEFDQDYSAFVNRTLPMIQTSTQIAVDFNDKYATTDLSVGSHTFAGDLSKLGEALAERFELEDRLIDALHNCHRDQVA